MKLGVSSYSYSRLVGSGQMNQLDVPAKAKEMGFDVLEFSTLKVPEGETPLSFAPKLREACDRAGIPVANYTIGADFINGSNGNWQAEVERLKDEVRVAKILGAPGMRHDATRGFDPKHTGPKGFDDALPALIKGCRAVTEFAAGMGIKTMVENHGFFCQDSERVEKLVNGVNHSNFGLLVDMGNFLCADEDPGLAVGRLMPYAIHCHTKDFHVKPGNGQNPGKGWFQSRGGNWLRGSIIGHGDVPVVQCLRIMKRAGYDGVLSIEFEGLEDVLTGIAMGLENLRRFVAETGC
ncbi:MAG: sugar phosphate isomerase/epimerase [Verrucomicrobiae bacterium]|nr:sugar phosphate isomerase/epimerase [Verrucomicrobiae bacterium]